MPKVNLLYDVEPSILTLCKQGANRQRIFLKKEHEGREDLRVLPGGHVLLRKGTETDWSYFYCVVAEPGAREDAGVGDGKDSGIEDQWRDEAEIRKAAHFFAKSDRLVTGLHDTVQPFGLVVENAIAIADFAVDTPDGAKTIKKGSWYVGIEPTPEGKVAIDAGEFTGLSLEGPGYRQQVELAKSGDEERVSLWKKMGEMLGISSDRLPKDSGTLENDPLTEDDVADNEKLDKLDTQVQDIAKAQSATTTAIEGLVATVDKLMGHFDAESKARHKKDEGEKKDDTSAEDIKKSLDELTETFATKLDEIEAQVDKIADSGSTQDKESDLKKSKTDAYELSGIL